MKEGDYAQAAGWLVKIVALPSKHKHNELLIGTEDELADVQLLVLLDASENMYGHFTPRTEVSIYRWRLQPLSDQDPVLIDLVVNLG